MSGVGWPQTVTAAEKILGKDGKLPKPRVDPNALISAVSKTFDAFDKSRVDLEKQLLSLENSYSQAKNSLKQYDDLVANEDFGLKEDDPADKKRIADVTAILDKFLESNIGTCDLMLDRLSKLDRLLMDLRKVGDLNI